MVNTSLRSLLLQFFKSPFAVLECSNILPTFGIKPQLPIYSLVAPLAYISCLPRFALLKWCMNMEGPGSNHSSSSTVIGLKLHRTLTPENSLASSPSTVFESSCGSSVHDSSISLGIQQYESSVDDSIPPWWEAEAEDILRGTDLQAIRLLCRYRIYRDSSIPASILRTRWTPTMDTFLLQLTAEIHSRRNIDDLDLDQKVEVLLRWLEPSYPADRTWLHSPFPALQLNASHVASELNEQSWSLFRDITFSDFVREALYPEANVEPVETFKDWHDDLFYQVLDQLEQFPAEEEKFVQIQQVRTILSTFFPR